jgi:1,4-alpha-glucan branching enzyme
VREALLTLSSDWAFMVTKDSAADYALRRAKVHGDRFAELAALLRSGHSSRFTRAAAQRAEDGMFGRLDARGLLS